jgi:hypothetical protein
MPPDPHPGARSLFTALLHRARAHYRRVLDQGLASVVRDATPINSYSFVVSIGVAAGEGRVGVLFLSYFFVASIGAVGSGGEVVPAALCPLTLSLSFSVALGVCLVLCPEEPSLACCR